jgi:hypothetical protein
MKKNSRNQKRQRRIKKYISNCSWSDDSVEDEKMANFVRKLNRGTRKNKGMLPLI